MLLHPKRSILLMLLDEQSRSVVLRGLKEEGFHVDLAYGAERAFGLAAMYRYDAWIAFAKVSVLVDWLRRLPSALNTPLSPLIAISSVQEACCIEEGLQAGAGVYLQEPVTFGELLAQLRALLRIRDGQPPHWRLGLLGIDPIARRASWHGAPLPLRSREFDLLLLLAEQTGNWRAGEELNMKLWPDYPSDPNRLAVLVRRLRQALGPAAIYLHAARRRGYRLAITGIPSAHQTRPPIFRQIP